MSHALLSPSASHRWIACPPSARLTEFLAESESSYAAEGTVAHNVAEAKLKHRLGIARPPIVCEDAEMDEYTSDYADFVMEQTEGLKNPVVYVEQRVDCSGHIPECYGTCDALRGVEDETNIAYGAGTNPNPTCTAYWTSQRFSIGDVTITPGESLFILERSENVTSAINLTSTATASVNQFNRTSYLRYTLSGNVSGSGGVNSVRGPLQTVLPIGSVVIGGQGGLLYPATYDCHLITLCRQSDTSEKELDFYISNDEETFTRISRSTPVGSNTSAESLHIHIQMRQARIPAGYGLYVCMGSDGTSATAYCDLKFTYHLYPTALTTETTL